MAFAIALALLAAGATATPDCPFAHGKSGACDATSLLQIQRGEAVDDPEGDDDAWGEDAGPAVIAVFVKKAASCGAHGDLLGSDQNANECAALASGAGSKTFSLGTGIHRGKCFASTVSVSDDVVEKWNKNRKDPVCPAGDWSKDPNFDFYYWIPEEDEENSDPAPAPEPTPAPAPPPPTPAPAPCPGACGPKVGLIEESEEESEAFVGGGLKGKGLWAMICVLPKTEEQCTKNPKCNWKTSCGGPAPAPTPSVDIGFYGEHLTVMGNRMYCEGMVQKKNGYKDTKLFEKKCGDTHPSYFYFPYVRDEGELMKSYCCPKLKTSAGCDGSKLDDIQIRRGAKTLKGKTENPGQEVVSGWCASGKCKRDYCV